MTPEHTILYVDDEEENLNLFYNSFKRQFRILRAKNATEALRLCQSERVDLIVADQRMPGTRGIDLLAQLAREQSNMVRILITGYADMSVAVEAINRGKVHRYVSKPWEREALQDILNQELRFYDLRNENVRLAAELQKKALALEEKNENLSISNQRISEAKRLLEEKSNEYERLYRQLQQKMEENRTLRQAVEQRFSLRDLVGQSAAMQSVFQFIRDVAPTEATILILGESGTGKELVARAIHSEGLRKDKPFVVVNCAALPENLLESELFGHEKGAFTGAIRRKRGRFEQAQGGTIFLDEIGDISPATQLRLLRVLQEKTFVRVGGEETLRADVRIISATNQDLHRAMAEGRFREDLYYRLNVISLTIAPLRDRPEDIPLLCQRFLVRHCAMTKKKIKGFSNEAMQRLMDYPWPGNVRELQNLVERTVILCKSDVITPDLFPPNFLGDTPAQSAPKSLCQAEKELIHKTLLSTGWNKHQAAKLLDITRSSLYSKIQRYGLTPPDKSI
ncbi:MAG: sigma 54-interacting transcriptional regulator [bacterium]